MKELENDITQLRKKHRISQQDVAMRSGASVSSVKRVETNHESVTTEMRSDVIKALAELVAEKADRSVVLRGDSLADKIELHALALLDVAKSLRSAKKEVGRSAILGGKVATTENKSKHNGRLGESGD